MPTGGDSKSTLTVALLVAMAIGFTPACRGSGSPDAGPADGGAPDSGSDAGSDAGFVALPADLPIGIDIVDLFWAYKGGIIATPGSQMPSILAGARDAGFTHVRFFATPPWPIQMTTGNGWVADAGAYWAAMDSAIYGARAQGLRVIPSLFTSPHLFPDVAGEPTSALFTPDSGTRLLAESYVRQFVTRYHQSDAILFWEIGNEFNLWADSDFTTCDVCGDGGVSTCGEISPPLGTPCRRTAADEFYSCNSCRGVSGPQQDLAELFESIGTLIHQIDSRPISSGYSTPRPYAYHLAVSPAPAGDGTPDTEGQFRQILAYTHPADIDIVSAHVGAYFSSDNARFGSCDATGVDLLGRLNTAAQLAGKQLFAGEITEARQGTVSCNGTQVCGGDPARTDTRALLAAMVAEHVAYGALWGWQEYLFCPNTPDCIGIEPGDPIVSASALYNAAYSACVAQADGTTCPIGSCQSQTCVPLGGFVACPACSDGGANPGCPDGG